MPFNGPGPGRPRGSLNKRTIEVRDAARAIIDDPVYREGLKSRIAAGIAPHMETLLWHYAYGKPKETVEVPVEENPLDGATAEQLRERAMTIAQRIIEQPEEAVH